MGGSLEWSEIQPLLQLFPKDYSQLDVFIETGTYKANTTLEMAKHFKEVYTCEIHQELTINATLRAKKEGVNNVKFFLCDSVPFLKEILLSIPNSGVYFLDAHISGSDSGWNGYNRVPLIEELTIILDHKGKYSNIIIIDDARFFDGSQVSPPDWAHITPKIINTLVEKYTRQYFSFIKNDRMFILLN